MLVYVANLLVDHFIDGPLAEPGGYFPNCSYCSARLPIIVNGTRLHFGFIIALLITVLVYFIIWRTSLGGQLRMYLV